MRRSVLHPSRAPGYPPIWQQVWQSHWGRSLLYFVFSAAVTALAIVLVFSRQAPVPQLVRIGLNQVNEIVVAGNFLSSSTSTAPASTSESTPASAATAGLWPDTPEASVPVAELPAPTTQYGHLPYEVADPSTLVWVDSYGAGDYKRDEFLEQYAAHAFLQMQEAAQAEQIELVAMSAFRDYARQERLFTRQVERRGSPEVAAHWSAPPGYSEHHTGYAVDIGDGSNPSQDFQTGFDQTPAFQWLQAHAWEYAFEMSFPKNNPMDIAYEPWHWRFVGTERANLVFYAARQP